MKTLSEVLKNKRLELGIKQKVAAKRLGITSIYLCQLETNNITTTLETLEKICNYYKLDTKKMLDLMNKNMAAYSRAKKKYEYKPKTRVVSKNIEDQLWKK